MEEEPGWWEEDPSSVESVQRTLPHESAEVNLESEVTDYNQTVRSGNGIRILLFFGFIIFDLIFFDGTFTQIFL